MLVLKLLRLILPPFHPLKYKYINWWYGQQAKDGGWKDKKVNSKIKS